MAEPARVENAGGSDQEILDKARVTFTLAGREYEWIEPSASDKRELSRKILKISGTIKESDPDSVITVILKQLGFLCEIVPAMKKDHEYLNTNAESEDIAEAFFVIQEVVLGNFLRYQIRKAQEIRKGFGIVDIPK